MTGIIDYENLYVGDLPTIWSPIQEALTEGEQVQELENQATASLLWAADVPEAILRLLVQETGIQRVFEPPAGYDPELQGEWNETLVTFEFKRSIHLESIERESESLVVTYKLEGAGYWRMEFSQESLTIDRM